MRLFVISIVVLLLLLLIIIIIKFAIYIAVLRVVPLFAVRELFAEFSADASLVSRYAYSSTVYTPCYL